MSFGHETQAESSRRMYTARADEYDDSFHPELSTRFMAIADVQPGERVLVLACGTGLEVFMAADRAGPDGEVVGVDLTDAMLAKARAKLEQRRDDPAGAGNSKIHLLAGDATRLEETVPELRGRTFDAVLCCSAFVLFDDPTAVARSWRQYLELAGRRGRLVVDVTHEDNLKPSLLLERAVRRGLLGQGVRFPSNRTWVRNRDSLAGILRGAGYEVERVEQLDRISGRGDAIYGRDQMDEQFERAFGSSITAGLAVTEELRTKARAAFREEWERDAVDGKVVSVDAIYVYVAKPA